MISVVIPLYNKEQSIAKTLDSVMAQTYRDFEVVIVNDGSTDHSAQVVEEYIQKTTHNVAPNNAAQPTMRLINKTNGGVSSARNRGILDAKGEYVAFLDADDLWANNYLEELSNLIHDFPDAGLYAQNYHTMCGDVIPECPSLTKESYRYVSQPWNGRLKPWTGSSSSSRANLIAVGLFDERMAYGEDIDMWWRLILYKGAVLNEKCVAFYRQDAENRAMHKVIPLEKHIPYYMDKFLEARQQNADFRKFFDTQMIYRLYSYLFDNQYRNEAKRLAKQLDYSQLKWSMHFRMQYPWLYHFYEKLKGEK